LAPRFYDLTYDDIVRIHRDVVQAWSSSPKKIHEGIQNKGLLESIAKRPSQKHYNHIPFPDIYSKCASLMESIIKWHPFVDGNKRTGLAVAFLYMYKNNYLLVTPISAVRFSVLVADNQKTFEDIREWIQTHTAHNIQEYTTKLHQYIDKPVAEVLLLYRSETPEATKKADEIMNEWLALDIYPEYRMTRTQTVDFLIDLLRKSTTISAEFFSFSSASSDQ